MILSFIAILIFGLIHLSSLKTIKMGKTTHERFLSMSGGVALAFVFVDLLPNLCSANDIIRASGFFPVIERHVFVLALLGFLLFFVVDGSSKEGGFWLPLASYAIFNFLIGYSVADPTDPEVQPFLLFIIAIGLHYFINDYSMSQAHYEDYLAYGRWILIAVMFAGWTVGFFFKLPDEPMALINSFIAGGVLMNVMRHELPKKSVYARGVLLLAAVAYCFLLLSIGS